jgi:hypothetical protein
MTQSQLDAFALAVVPRPRMEFFLQSQGGVFSFANQFVVRCALNSEPFR